jgi:signal transduction histidine kinase
MATAAATVLLFGILRERRDARGQLFAALAASFGTWSFARALGASLFVDAGAIALGLLVPASSLALCGPLPRLREPRGLLLWVPPALLAVARGVPALPEVWVGRAAHAWLLAGVCAGTVWLHRSGRARAGLARDTDSPSATRRRYLAWCLALTALAACADILADQLGRPRIATLLAGLFYLYAGYLHLAEVRVKDLRQLMGDTVALALLAGCLAGTFAALWLWVGAHLDTFVFNAFVASFLLLLFLEPARARIQAAMDRRFVAGRLELERVFGPLLERLPNMVTLDQLLREVLEATESAERLRASALYLRDDPQVGFQQVGSFGLPSRRRVHLIRAPAWVEALESSTVLQRDELERTAAHLRAGERRARIEALYRTIIDLDAHLVLPLRAGDRLLGFWTLTDRSVREPFSSTEVDLLESVAHQVAVAIDNTKTFEQVRARDRLAMLGEMSAGLAHEIRNPIAAIRGSVALLAHPSTESADDIRKLMLEEIDRLDRLVETFLHYAQPSGERSTIPDIAGLVAACIEQVQRSVCAPGSATGTELTFHPEPNLPAITASPDQLERVVLNVLQNAYDALDGEGHVGVTVRAQSGDDSAGTIEIIVTDDGPGLDAHTKERAFIPFFSTKSAGRGLGLPLCERLMRAQGGSIVLSSEPGEGTEVLLRLPLRPPQSAAA